METTEAAAHTTIYQLGSWEEFQEKVASFEDPTRKPWDEVWFRGQANAQWRLHTTLERRSTKIRAVAAYLNVIAEIKSAIETFTSAEFNMPTRTEVEQTCREYDRFEWVLRESATWRSPGGATSSAAITRRPRKTPLTEPRSSPRWNGN
jgi:hypothetical protein